MVLVVPKAYSKPVTKLSISEDCAMLEVGR